MIPHNKLEYKRARQTTLFSIKQYACNITNDNINHSQVDKTETIRDTKTISHAKRDISAYRTELQRELFVKLSPAPSKT